MAASQNSPAVSTLENQKFFTKCQGKCADITLKNPYFLQNTGSRFELKIAISFEKFCLPKESLRMKLFFKQKMRMLQYHFLIWELPT